jgi:hypothetical protein
MSGFRTSDRQTRDRPFVDNAGVAGENNKYFGLVKK